MSKFKVGDKVKIVEGSRRGWIPAMDKYIGCSGVIHHIGGAGDFLVVIDGHTSWWFYPDSFVVVNKFKGNTK